MKRCLLNWLQRSTTDEPRLGLIVALFLATAVAWAIPTESFANCAVWKGNQDPLNPIDLGTWDGISDITVNSPKICIVSTVPTDTSGNGIVVPYLVTVNPIFRLYKIGDTSQSFPITVEWLNSAQGESDVLSAGQLSNQFTGRNKAACQISGSDPNGQMAVTASGSDLQSLPPGAYTADLVVTAQTIFGETCADTSVSPTLTISGDVIVANVDDIDIDATAWTGGALSAVEDFCIGSNLAGSSFAITVSSAHAGGAGEFQVADELGSAGTAGYTATLFKRPGATGPATALTSGALQAPFDPHTPQDLNCTGDNVSLEVSFSDAALGTMQATGAKSWGDTVTIEVAPF